MDKQFDVVAIGEYLIDFSPNGCSRTGNPQYEMKGLLWPVFKRQGNRGRN